MKTSTRQHLLSRQFNFLAPKDWEGRRVHIIGCGGLGSTAAVILGKMGAPEIHLYDMDIVEDININNQFFGPANIDQPKVDAIKENVANYVGEDVCIAHNGKVEETMEFDKLDDEDIIIIGLDSNDTRRWVYTQIKEQFPPWKKLYIFDTRMGGLTFDVFFGTSQIIDKLLDETPFDKDVPDDLCTAKAIAFNTFGCSSFLGAMLRRHLVREAFQESFYHIQVCMQNNIIITRTE